MKRPVHLLAAAGLLTFALTACDSSVGPGEGTENEYSHLRGVGMSAADFLRDDAFTALTVEVDFMPGHAPDAQALDQLVAFLAERLHKTTITVRTATEIPSGGQQAYTLEDVRALEDQHRDVFSGDGTLAAYMLIVDGEYEEPNVLGIAHLNTSTAFFGATLAAVTGGLTQPSRRLAEATVFRHEFGHLLGLVALPGSGTDMQTEHRDEANGHHCDDDLCLMYFAMSSADLLGSVLGGEVPELDTRCIEDLQANGGR